MYILVLPTIKAKHKLVQMTWFFFFILVSAEISVKKIPASLCVSQTIVSYLLSISQSFYKYLSLALPDKTATVI